MYLRRAPAVVAATLALAAGCHEATSPGPLALSLSATARSLVLATDSGPAVADSVRILLTGEGAAQASWTVTHGQAPWVTLGTTTGTGDGVVRWTRDPGQVIAGVWVDTITVGVAGSPLTAQLIDSLVVTGPLPTQITERRPWLPGERDSTIARIARFQSLGEFSDVVDSLLGGTESVTVVVPNPALAVAGASGSSRLAQLGQAGQTWMIFGLQIREVFPNPPGSATLDSLKWLGVFWFASPESTWTGRVVAATSASTMAATTVNTAAFDASGAKSGAGGGEARRSTGNYWEANSGTIRITANVCSPSSCANTTFTSGPWQGGQWHGLLMGGALSNIVAPCLLPAGCTVKPDTFNVSFLSWCIFGFCFGSPIQGYSIDCVFPSPCTGSAAARLADLARRGEPLDAALFGRPEPGPAAEKPESEGEPKRRR
jgi:hypothetical protein